MIRIRRSLLLLPLLAFVLLAGAGGWLLFSSAGAAAVLRAVSQLTPLQLEAAQVEGRLAGELVLRQVDIGWPQGGGRAEQLLLRWRPLPLLVGKVAIEQLQLEEAEVRLAPAAAEPGGDFSLPEVGGLPLRLRAEIERLQVAGLTIRAGAEEPFEIERLQGNVAWDSGELRLQGIDFHGSPGRVTGSGTVDFTKPALALDLRFVPAREDFESLFVQADLQSESGRQMVGPATLTLREAGTASWSLQAAIDWRPDRIAFSELRLARPGHDGEISGEGAVTAGEDWPFDLSLHFAGIDLRPETGLRTALFGRLVAEGNRNGWHGRFNLENRVAGWQQGDLAGTFRGDGGRVSIGGVEGNWLQGKLQGELTAAWEAGLQLQGRLAGRGLQPEVVAADWPGRINFDLQGRFVLPKDGAAATASIDGSLHDSVLRGRALTGGIAVAVLGEDVRIERLALRGDGFDLQAEGRLQERIDFRANVSRLGGLLPEARGSLRLSGWTGRRQGILVGELAARGEQVAWRALQLGRGTIEARRAAKGGAFLIDGDFVGLGWGDYRLATAAVRAEGSLAEHRLRLRTTGSDLQSTVVLRGGLTDDEWQGELLELNTAGRLAGQWSTGGPTALRIGANHLQLANIRLAGEGEEFLSLAGDLVLSPLRGWLDAEWEQLNLARGNPWLKEIAVHGRSSGAARVEWLPEDRLELRGQLTAAGTVGRGGQQIQMRQVEARVEWNAEGLHAAGDADLAGLGTVSVSATSPRAASFAWPAAGSFAAHWRLDDLAPLSPWLPELRVSGQSSGEISGSWSDGEESRLVGKAEMSGAVNRNALRFDIRRAQTTFAWEADGLEADWSLDLGRQGVLAGEFTSGAPPQFSLPETGQLRASWEKVDLAVMRPWLPDDLLLGGILSGDARGEWLHGQRLRLSGAARVVDGDLQWQNADGVVEAGIQEARVNWTWQDAALAGDLRLQMEHIGEAEGSFRLPLPARWPVAMEPNGTVQGRLRAQLQEEGLLNAFFPGLIQESKGKLALDLRLGGTWEAPDFGGTLHLREAAAYLPTAGIRVEQVELLAKLAGQNLQIESLQLRSGPGRITGDGEIRLQRWRLASYQLRLRGENFRAIHLPELQLRVAPDLQVSGTPEKLIVRGELRIPSMLVAGKQTAAPVRPSSDIVIVDAPEKRPRRDLPLAIDIRVRLVLGEHVLVDMEGIDARLEGSLLLTMTGLDPEEITAQGEIRVAQGKYATYGVSLDITRGSILFAGGPVDRPVLDVRAMRTVGEVKAGVKVSGTPRQPRVELVSEPTMTDTDILSYIVLGHPIGQEGGANAGLLMLAANTLLSKGESAVLQDRLKRMFGLDVLQIDAGNGDVEGSQITIGKYLNPDLYISFGQSLFNNSNEVRMRYNLSRRWQIESSVGDESAVDLYYKIEFR